MGASGSGLSLDTLLETIDFERAAGRLSTVVAHTPLVELPWPDSRFVVRLKMECLQQTGSFKARGAWNQVSQLDDRERRAGVVATSSGNHGKALSWAAQRAGVPATICMPKDAYPNKIAACREYGATVVLCDSRDAAEETCAARVRNGAVLVHPFDAARTVEGAGTVGVEIARDWPEVDVAIVPVGGGGLIAGTALALRRLIGDRLAIVGVEPEGAPTLTRGLEAGHPVRIDPITTSVQGLCPINAGGLNIHIAQRAVTRVVTLPDDAIFAAQAWLVRRGWTVEPAGAAAFALLHAGRLTDVLEEIGAAGSPLRVAIVISGGNPDPAQLEAVRGAG